MRSPQDHERVLVIGLDVGDGTLIQKWAYDGTLPVFQRLLKEGAWRWLHSIAETLHISVWPTLYTGTFPGRHGVYYTFQPEPGRQGVRRFHSHQYGVPPLWSVVGEAGLRSVIFDAPYTHPGMPFPGVQIFDWGTWAKYGTRMSVPPDILQRLSRSCSAYPLSFEANQVGFASLDSAELHRQLLLGPQRKAQAVRWLMAQEPWDLFWVVFGETHAGAHYLWSEGGSEGPGLARLREIYMAIDRAIGQILDEVGNDVTLFITSPDRVVPNYTGWHLLPQVLECLGWSVPTQASGGCGETRKSHRGWLKHLRDRIPLSVRQAVSQRLPSAWRGRLTEHWAAAGVNWTRTRAFCLPTDLEGCVRINLRGREPQGIVSPGDEYESVCGALEASLRRLVNPRTGRSAVRDIILTDATMPGERRHYLPDLVVLWSDEGPIGEVHSPEFGGIQGTSPDPRPGTHGPPGFVVARGSGIPQGVTLEDGDLVGFASTLLTRFNIAPPSYMDGSAWQDLATCS